MRRQTLPASFAPLFAASGEEELSKEAAWPETPEASACSYYEFFVPSCVQEMVKRRLKQFETMKTLVSLLCTRDPKSSLDKLQNLLSDIELLQVPALGLERRGAEEIKAFRSYVLESLSDMSATLVDVVPEDFEGKVVKLRLIVRAVQTRPVFPHMPMNALVTCGLQASVTLNDEWKPKALCWSFIPVEPLLTVKGIQSMVFGVNPKAAEAAVSPAFSETCSTAASVDEEDVSGESRADSLDLEDLKAKKAHDHACGVCVPCSFHCFREDGCRHGDACQFCHHCDLESAKQRRRAIRKEERAIKRSTRA